MSRRCFACARKLAASAFVEDVVGDGVVVCAAVVAALGRGLEARAVAGVPAVGAAVETGHGVSSGGVASVSVVVLVEPVPGRVAEEGAAALPGTEVG